MTKLELTGQTFTRLTVLGKASIRHDTRKRYWKVKCECGVEKEVRADGLRSGEYKSCGCLNKELARQLNFMDLTGRIYGRLTVIKETTKRSKSGSIYWECICSCKTIKRVRSDSLISGMTKSCGCLGKEMRKRGVITHGLSYTSEYRKAKLARYRDKKAKLDTMWTTEMEKALLNLQPKCVVCGSTDRLATDHVKPLSKGYGLEPGNAVKLCRSCNSSKGNKNLSELASEISEKIINAAVQFNKVWQKI